MDPAIETRGNLTGNYHVRIFRPAFMDAHRVLPRTRDRAEVRRHALKLRFFPDRHPETDEGVVLDLDYSLIKALPGENIGELRISDHIGGCRNLRVVFYVAGETKGFPLPVIWILCLFNKKRDDFSRQDIRIFRGRKRIVEVRFGY